MAITSSGTAFDTATPLVNFRGYLTTLILAFLLFSSYTILKTMVQIYCNMVRADMLVSHQQNIFFNFINEDFLSMVLQGSLFLDIRVHCANV